MMDGRIVSGDAEFWTRARRHLLKYGGTAVAPPPRCGG